MSDAQPPGPSKSYPDLLSRTWQENRLFVVLLELTYRCNLDCFYCYNDTARPGQPLSRQQYFDLLHELAELDVMHLILSGGEPLAHPDFFAIGNRARELGFAVRVKSNGHALRGRLARRLKDEVDPFVVDLSIHGACAETHDRQTRVAGSFDRLLANIREMQALGLRLKLNCTLTAWNEGEIESIARLGRDLGLKVGFSSSVTPRDDGDRSPLDIAPTREGLLRLWQYLDQAQGEVTHAHQADELMPPTAGRKNCGAGSSSVSIDPYGDVLPCVQWRRSIGNLHERSLREIWTRSPALDDLRAITTAAEDLKVEIGRTGGAQIDYCPGLAELVTGDPLVPDGDLLRRQGVLREHQSGRRGSALRVLPS